MQLHRDADQIRAAGAELVRKAIAERGAANIIVATGARAAEPSSCRNRPTLDPLRWVGTLRGAVGRDPVTLPLASLTADALIVTKPLPSISTLSPTLTSASDALTSTFTGRPKSASPVSLFCSGPITKLLRHYWRFRVFTGQRRTKTRRMTSRSEH